MHRLHVMNLLANAIFAVSICWTALAVRHVHFLPLMVFVCNVNGVCGWQQAAWTALHTVPQWWRIGNSRSSCSNMYAPIKNAFKGNHYFIARAKATQFWKISLTTWIWLRFFFLSFFYPYDGWMVGWMDRVARKSINQIMVEWMKQKLFSFLRMQLARPLFRSIRVNVELWAVHMCERVNGLTHTVVDSEGE